MPGKFQTASRVAASVLICTAIGFADCKYTTNSSLVGGTLLQMIKFTASLSGSKTETDNAQTTIYFKGHRLRSDSPGHIRIIDADKRQVIDIDTEKRQYSVQNFDQWREQLKQARAASEQRASAQGATSATAASGQVVADMQPGSEKKTVGNWSAAEMLVKYAIVSGDNAEKQDSGYHIVTDVYFTTQIEAGELLQFYRNLSDQLGIAFGPFTPPAVIPAQFNPGMDQLSRTLAELPGFPVQQTVRLQFVAPPQPKLQPAEHPDPSEPAVATPAAALSEAQSTPAAAPVAHHSGLFGGQHKKKKEKTEPKQPDKAENKPTTLLVIYSTVVDFSSATLDADIFNLPAGYQQVQ